MVLRMLGQSICNNSTDKELCNLCLFIWSGRENKNYLFNKVYISWHIEETRSGFR